ncbi:hypothetical protein BD414DRAFT_458895 [Trametes punicea]|nr:hypothetical protein BD414DRAFT_458895 [Trametes punicea]
MSRRPSSGSIGLPNSPELGRQNGPATVATRRGSAIHLEQAAQARRPATRATSSSQKVDSSINMNNIDPDELFTKHTVPEIKLVQSRLRAEADAKQEELRLMVGERYRDLLQASTSILNLAKSSKRVLEALEDMRDTVSSITPSRAPKRATTSDDKHLQALQSLSAHVKLLLDAPEHLWRLMERKAYLNAAWLFLLARVVHRALSQDEDEQIWHDYGIDVAEHLPVVQRQWDTITPFRSQVSHRATLSLREISSTPGEVCATLLTLHLLESRPLPETLSIFLVQRMKTLSSLLNRNASGSANGHAPNTKPNGKAPHKPRKAIVRETKQRAEAALDAVSCTIAVSRLIFSGSPGHSSMMKQALDFFQNPSDTPGHLPSELQLSTQNLLSSLPSSSQLLLLPLSIRTYKPYVDGSPLATPDLQTQLRDKLGDWFQRSVQDIRHALSDWFAPLESVRDVWDVRSGLLQWLKNADGLESSERQEFESVIEAVALEQATTVWKAALHHLEASFRDEVGSASTALTESVGAHFLDTRPAEYLFQAIPIPSGLQAGAHNATAAAVQFSKYRSSLQQQINCRTPLLHSALSVLEQHAIQIREDLSVMQKSPGSKREYVDRISTSYRADAEASCGNICEVLEAAAGREDAPLWTIVFIGRIAQQLSSSSNFFAQIGCGEAAAEAHRRQLGSLASSIIRKWQAQTVSQIIERHLGSGQLRRIYPADDNSVPSRPSPAMIQALLSLSSEMQYLDICLEDEGRRLRVASTLQEFVVAVINRVEQDNPPIRPQLLWDLTLLRQLVRLWEASCKDPLDVVDCTIGGFKEHDLDASTLGYLSKTQVLLAALLPTRPASSTISTTKKADRTSSLLLFGPPPIEQGFDPALRLIKTPPRFGLLLAGGAAVK